MERKTQRAHNLPNKARESGRFVTYGHSGYLVLGSELRVETFLLSILSNLVAHSKHKANLQRTENHKDLEFRLSTFDSNDFGAVRN